MSGLLHKIALIALGTVLIAGCQQDTTSQSENSLDFGGQQIRESELRAYCPQPLLQESTALLRNYDRGGEGDPNRITYQAVISETTRKCEFSEGGTKVHVVTAGRVVPGPKGRAGTVSLPIRVQAMRGDQVVYSQLIRHQVTINETSGATQFLLSDPNVMIPGLMDRSVKILVGFEDSSKR